MDIDLLIKQAKKEDELYSNNTPTKTFKEIETQVLNSGDNEYILEFALQNFKGTDKKAFQQKIIESKDWVYNLCFATYVKGIDVLLNQEAILNTSCDRVWLRFAREIKGADIKAIQDKILTTFNKHTDADIFYMLAMLDGTDTRKVQKAFLVCEKFVNWNDETSESVMYKNDFVKYAYMFARDVKGADVKALEQIILKANEPQLSFKFVKEVKGADFKAHRKIIEASKDKKLVKEFKKFAIKKFFAKLLRKNKVQEDGLTNN